MRFDLDIGSQFLEQQSFEAGRDLVRCSERKFLSTSRSSETASFPAIVRRDVMHRQRLIARDHHHALRHTL
jgi:hypothetical protein